MFRRSIITITFAAIAFIAVGSPEPASAHAWDCFIEPTHCVIELGAMVIEGDSDEEVGSVTGGGLISSELTPGGLSSDSPIETVVVPQISEDLLDELTGPTVDLPETLTLPEQEESPVDEDAADDSESAPEPDETDRETAPADADTPVSVATPAPDTESPDSVDTEGTTPPVALDETSDSANSLDPTMAAMLGALGSLVVLLFIAVAFAAGRRSN
jgi:hypothetical protein